MRAGLVLGFSVLLMLYACTDDDAGGDSAAGAGGGSAQSGSGGKGSSSTSTGSGGYSGSTSGGTGNAGGDDSGGGATDPGTGPCGGPTLAPVDDPDRVIGDGTPESCTSSALADAAAAGGVITFDCGPDPVTISVDSTIVFTSESVLDGGGLVTLSGGGSARILYLDSAYDQDAPRLTVQRLRFVDGNSPAGGDDTTVGGGAIYRDGGSLTVVDCTFEDNHAPAEGQDVAGGAIYAFGGGETVIASSTFTGNSASNGGAVGSLNGTLAIFDSTFTGNSATGTDGNPGNGGCGGGIYMDGADELTDFCGVTISGNSAGAIGGGFFRVSNDDNGTFVMARSSVTDNAVTPTTEGNAGGLYLQGLEITINASTIARNEAFFNGGIWINESHAVLTNVTIAENTAFGSNGGGVWLGNDPTGAFQNCTIANNHSTADGQVAGAIFGAGMTLENTLIAGNTAMYSPGCQSAHVHESAGGNLQWPDGSLCTDSPTVADPMLGPLGDNGGPTETMVPAEGSPAIGLGTNCAAEDQHGEPRGEPCTVGAVEVQ